MTYNFSATQNNGRIVSSADAVTGENVSYTYDSLNRLIAAASTGVQWSESYSYDGFGNMTGKTSTKGTPANPQVDSTTNRARIINDYGFDANGNWLGVPGPLVNLVNTWNVENQLVSNGLLDSSGNPFTNTYDPAGKRVLQYSVNASYGPWGTLYFYSITGQRLATYHLYYVTGTPTTLTTSMYFGGRLLAPVDRLGSVRGNANGSIAYFPWGEEEKQPTGYTTPDGTDKYATYFRDGTTNGAGEDYANARYYNNNFGRFWSPDPAGNAHANDPQSWNRYSYVGSDPVNQSDPSGLGSICTVWAADNRNCIVGVPTPFPLCWGGTEDDPVFTCFGDGAGGTGGTQPTQPAKPSSPCNPTGNADIAKRIQFITSNYAAAANISSATGTLFANAIPTDWILGWSAMESNWGATATTASGQSTGQYFGWGGSGNGNMPCPAGATPGFACFISFGTAAGRSLFSTNNYFTYFGQTGVAMATVLEGALATGLSATAAFQAVANTGYAGPDSQPGYGTKVDGRIGQVDALIDCMQQNGII
jgi:RHS repeat-associated protein